MDEFDLQPSVLRLGFLKDFHCDSSVCIENCCNKYSIVKIDKETYQKYEDSAPEVAKNIKYNDEKGYHEIILGEHFACPFYGDNLCSVQCKYGEDFLSETCAFYPRVFRRLNNLILVSATCACSEITKQAIFSEEENFNWEDTILKRIKKDIIDFV